MMAWPTDATVAVLPLLALIHVCSRLSMLLCRVIVVRQLDFLLLSLNKDDLDVECGPCFLHALTHDTILKPVYIRAV